MFSASRTKPPKAAKRMANTAFLFPGQGSQYVGMGADAYTNSIAARAIFEEADQVLGIPLSTIMLEGATDKLVHTQNAQPAILTVSIAYLSAMTELLGDSAPTPDFVAGHSLGEYTALVAADSLSFKTALQLVRKRGELMQEAADLAPSGLAAVLGMRLDEVEAVCADTGVQVANVNSETQIVIGGELEPLQHAIASVTELGARRVILLDVAGAFHTKVMRSAQNQLIPALASADVRSSKVPVVANTSANALISAQEIRQELERQTCLPVLWQSSIELMVAKGVERFIEIGPGKVLTGLAKRIAPSSQVASVGTLDAIEALA